MGETRENTGYRSDVFSLLLQEKERALEVYNAMNGTSYDDPELVEIVPVENRGISLSVRNDASFVLDASLSIYEHQSTICPNMPVRYLIYFANIIHERIRKKNIYGKTLIRIPTPRFVEMMQLDYTFERQLELEREESYMKGREELIASMLRSGKTPEEIVSFAGVPMNEVKQVHEEMHVNVKELGTNN